MIQLLLNELIGMADDAQMTLDDFLESSAPLPTKNGTRTSNHQWKCRGCDKEFKGSKLRALAHIAKQPGHNCDPCKHKWTAPEKWEGDGRNVIQRTNRGGRGRGRGGELLKNYQKQRNWLRF